MYIIFDENGKEQLRYFLDKLPEELTQSKYIKLESEDEIPKKDGFIERAILVGGNIEWEYEKIEEEEDRLAELNNEITLLSDTIAEFMSSMLEGDE